MSKYIDELLTHCVVLDTGGPIVYLGTLVRADEAVLVLEDADVHDCRDGHATAEVYVNEARTNGISPNRRSVVVMWSAVMSASKLADVVEQ